MAAGAAEGPGLDQLFSDLLDATETEYDPEGKERVRRKLDSILVACPAPNSPPRSGNLRRWRWSLRIIEYAAAVAAVVRRSITGLRQPPRASGWEVYAAMGERREIVLPRQQRTCGSTPVRNSSIPSSSTAR